MSNVKAVLKSAVLFAGMLMAMPSWAYIINGTTDVGEVDNVIAMSNLADVSEAGEIAWVESVVGYTVTLENRILSGLDWTAVDGQVAGSETIFAQALGATPDYYMLKYAYGSDILGNDTILFENVASLAYAVIDTVALGQGSVVDIYGVTLSHISEFQVPEPAPLALLGLGLLGLISLRKKGKLN